MSNKIHLKNGIIIKSSKIVTVSVVYIMHIHDMCILTKETRNILKFGTERIFLNYLCIFSLNFPHHS